MQRRYRLNDDTELMKTVKEDRMRLNLLVFVIAMSVSMGIATASFAGPGLGDTDGDGIDDFFDNCLDDSNSTGPNLFPHLDTDRDGCGNLCDGDFTQDGVTNGADFIAFRVAFAADASGDTDMDGSGGTNGADFILFRVNFAQGFPGASSNTFRDTARCP